LASSSLKDVPDAWDIEYEDFLMAFKTSLMFMDWMKEMGEDKILDTYDFAPGELYNKITNADWLLYAAKELSILQGKKEVANNLNKLRLRVKYGVKEELIKLIMLKNIGRIRARALWKNGIKTPSDIKKAGKEKLGRILGPKIADSILQQIG
jgi:helicase